MSKFNFDLQREIEQIMRNGTDVIDAVIHVCEKYSLDIETVASIIKKDAVLKSKVQMEAENLNILRRSARLPI